MYLNKKEHILYEYPHYIINDQLNIHLLTFVWHKQENTTHSMDDLNEKRNHVCVHFYSLQSIITHKGSLKWLDCR